MRPLFLLLGVALGLWTGGFFGIGPTIVVLSFFVVCLFWARHKRHLRAYLIAYGVGALLGALTWLPYPAFERIEGFVVYAAKNYVIVLSGFRRYYVSIPGHSYELFDLLSVRGGVTELSFIRYESQFDFVEFLGKMGVKKGFYAEEVSAIIRFPFRIKTAEDGFCSSLNAEAKALSESLLFSRRDYDSTTILHAQSLGLLYLFSSSGLILSLFFRFLETLFISVLGPKRVVMMTLVLSFAFLFLSQGKVGALRIFVMTAVRLFFVLRGKKELSYRRRAIGALIVLAIDFHFCFQDGFLLGFGIGFMMDASHAIRLNFKQTNRRWVTLALIRSFLLPMQINSQDGFAILSLFYALAMTPVAVAFSFVGFLSFFLLPMPALLNPFASGIDTLLTWFDAFNPMIPLPRLGPFFCGIFYGGFFLFIFIREIGDLRLAYSLPLSFVGLFVVSLVPIVPVLTQEVSFVNVGQGDCILIRDHLTSVMIDCGGVNGMDLAKESLIPFLRRKRIYKIDCLIASHGDYDHIGAKDSLMANFQVLRYVDSHAEFPLTIGKLTFFNHNETSDGDENDRSLFLSLSFMGESFLFTGDAPVGVELQAIKKDPGLRCGILKVGHHGSSTSTHGDFLDAVKPHTAIVSVAAKNRYGHPNKEVLERLKARGIKIRRTDLEGTITYSKFTLF